MRLLMAISAFVVLVAVAWVSALVGRGTVNPGDTYLTGPAAEARQYLVPFEENGRWGYRSAVNDAVVIPPTYLQARDFSEGLAAVRLESTAFAFVDPQGRIAVGPLPQVLDVEEFSEGLASFIADSGLSGYIDRSGRVVIPARFYGAEPFRGGVAVVGVSGGVQELAAMLDLGTGQDRIVINYRGEKVGDFE